MEYKQMKISSSFGPFLNEGFGKKFNYGIGSGVVVTKWYISSIISSQHDYFFVPTTERQILI
jgi:hypothetical protein